MRQHAGGQDRNAVVTGAMPQSLGLGDLQQSPVTAPMCRQRSVSLLKGEGAFKPL